MTIEIIAEIGWNFMGDMELASKMIKESSDSGATTAKFQYWNPSKLKPGAWDHDGRREIYLKAALNDEKILFLLNECKRNNINFLISAFNVEDAKYLLNLGIKDIKVPSHESGNFDLHKFCAKNFKKIYASLGAASVSEVTHACSIYNESNCDWVAMHCVSSYPLNVDRANLRRISWLNTKSKFVGYSDHTECITTPAFAILMGASVIEKHFTLDKNLPGRDNKFALTPEQFALMVSNIELAASALIDRGLDYQDIESDTFSNYRGRWG